MKLLNLVQKKPAQAVEPVVTCDVGPSFNLDDPIVYHISLLVGECTAPAVHQCHACGAKLCDDCAQPSLYKRNAYVCPKHVEL